MESQVDVHQGVLQYRQQIVADPQQFAVVRRSVGTCLRTWGLRSLVEATAMCVTEMLSNVHRHVESPDCELLLERLPEGIRAVVGDRSAALPDPVGDEPDCFAESGRGLFLLSRTADRWGSTPTATGKEVWVLLREEGFPGDGPDWGPADPEGLPGDGPRDRSA